MHLKVCYVDFKSALHTLCLFCVCVWSDAWNDKGWIEACPPPRRRDRSNAVSWLRSVCRVRKWHVCLLLLPLRLLFGAACIALPVLLLLVVVAVRVAHAAALLLWQLQFVDLGFGIFSCQQTQQNATKRKHSGCGRHSVSHPASPSVRQSVASSDLLRLHRNAQLLLVFAIAAATASNNQQQWQ